jgi:hypothetical protein
MSATSSSAAVDQRRGRGPGANAASHRDRILAWAIAGHVIHQDDWWPGPGPDGGPGIRAVRSRIPEIEAAGFAFDHRARADRTTEYRLAYVPERPVTHTPAPELDAGAEHFGGEQLPLLDVLDPPLGQGSGSRQASAPGRGLHVPAGADDPSVGPLAPAADDASRAER